MTGRERVIAALEFAEPDRVPRDLWALPYVSLFQPQELEKVLQHYPGDIGRSQRSPGSSDEGPATGRARERHSIGASLSMSPIRRNHVAGVKALDERRDIVALSIENRCCRWSTSHRRSTGTRPSC